jgi:hypothetical protein
VRKPNALSGVLTLRDEPRANFMKTTKSKKTKLKPQSRVGSGTLVRPAVQKPNDYRFMVVVKRAYTRRQAELALLTCFSLRAPDYCEFNLRRMPKQV